MRSKPASRIRSRAATNDPTTSVDGYYKLLDLAAPFTGTADDVSKAYKRASLRLHPDKIVQRGGTVTEADRARFQCLSRAHDVLSDPEKRKLYDYFGLDVDAQDEVQSRATASATRQRLLRGRGGTYSVPWSSSRND